MKEVKCPKCGESLDLDESDYNALVELVRTEEFNASVQEKLKEIESSYKSKSKLDLLEQERKFLNWITIKDSEIQKLKSEINNNDSKIKLAIAEERDKNNSEINKLINKISSLQSDNLALENTYKALLEFAKSEIERLKDFKLKLSTKMIGESLERHCNSEFNKLRNFGLFPNAYFEKDNEIVNGAKGDFVFRDYIDGEEYISIMFEMKNEADATKTKNKNEHFFEKLDQDRKNKNCDYAILVSMLEADNEEYNVGIVNMSHKYDKMYVIRPQFFILIICLLVASAQDSFKYKQELQLVKKLYINVTKFEEDLLSFQTGATEYYNADLKLLNSQIDNFDKIINYCEKQKKIVESRKKALKALQSKVDDLTIKQLIDKAKNLE